MILKSLYKLIEYDLIDIQFLESMSKLKLCLIWSDYDESRITLEIDELVHVTIHKLSSRGGKNIRKLPFFATRIVLSQTNYANEESRKMIVLNLSLGDDEMAHKLYHLKVECVEMVMEAVGLHVIVHDPHITEFQEHNMHGNKEP